MLWRISGRFGSTVAQADQCEVKQDGTLVFSDFEVSDILGPFVQVKAAFPRGEWQHLIVEPEPPKAPV